MSARPVLAIDAMGGDFGPGVIVPGVIQAARESNVKVLLVGDAPQVEAALAKLSLGKAEYDIVHASEVAQMHEKPSDILRRKKDSSIQVA